MSYVRDTDYIELSKEFLNKYKRVIDSFAESLYGVNFDTEAILCDIVGIGYKCYAVSKKGKIPVDLDMVKVFVIEKNDWYRDIVVAEGIIDKEELKKELQKAMMKKQLGTI